MKRIQMFVATATVLLMIAATVPTSFAAQKGDTQAGKKTYGVLCASCHGNSGKGDGPAAATLPQKPADHTDGKRMSALSDQFLFDIIKNGGTSVGKSPLMPPWGNQLKEQDIWNLVSYIRSLSQSGK